MRILVTGGRGTLGEPTVAAVQARGHEVTITSRRPDPAAIEPPQLLFDLESGDGAAAAVDGQDVVIHVASDTDKLGRADVTGSRALLSAAATAGVGHFVYISIVGCDEIPFGYYKRKTTVERDVAASGVPYTILRTTQYHEFAGVIADRLSKTYVTLVPKGVRFQSLDSAAAAHRLAELAEGPPIVRAGDMGGPEALFLSDLVKQYLAATGRGRPVVAVPLFGKAYQGFVAGRNLTNAHADRTGRTWAQWLAERTNAR